jgi:hypothetical protein
MWKIISLLITIVVIIYSIIDCYNGKKCDWVMYFIGWGSVLLYDLKS